MRANRPVAIGALLVVCLAAGCSSTSTRTRQHRPAASPSSSYWDRSRLLGAKPLLAPDDRPPPPRASASAHPARHLGALRVGAIFDHNASGNHFCTASVVTSPSEDLLITAAHCVNGGKSGGGYNTDIVFIPGYRDGQEPFGAWTPTKIFVAPQWAKSSDPDFDVAFIVLKPLHGKDIEQILGANRIAVDSADRYLVHVTGYPASKDAPISCLNTTTPHGDTQMEFDCDGYTGGTSGSPWVTDYDTRTHSGTVVGVVGGYEEGGDTASVSYSARFGPAILQLYREAIAAAPTAPPAE